MQRKFNKEEFLKMLKILPYNLMPLHDLIAPFVGLYVKEDQSPAFTITVIIIILANLIPSVIETYFSLGDINALAPCLPVFGILFALLTITTTLLIKRRLYVRLLDEMRPEFEEEFAVASEDTKANLKMATVKSITLLTAAFIVVSLFVVDALYSEKIVLGFPSWYPFDISVPTTYRLLFTLQICSGFVIGWTVFAVEVYFLHLSEQICMHINNLCNKLKFRLQTLSEKHSEPFSDQSFDDFLSYCAARHNALLERVRILDEMFSNFLLLHFVFFIFIMSVTALEFMSVTTEVTPLYIVKNTCLFVAGCTELYFPSITGSRLATAQAEVSEAVCSETVTLCSESATRTLSIMSIRSKVPVVLTIGGFKIFDIVGFSETLGAVYTIFTMLIQFKQGGI